MLFKPVFPVLDYVVNYDYISKVLCENKAKPEMQCNGKCHLMQELAKSSETEKPASQNDKKAFSPIELFCNTATEIVLEPVFEISARTPFYAFHTSKAVGFDGSVFHPPILA
ncbi:hypothetical protein [Flavobacterium sp.]|uniref:hypothetical protein n=1 Tax=Flavobacterium sp. TaxID=239 RepID=UPI0025C22ECC|nr:hypothetical protein [Flavobacterium sp.]